MLIHAQSEGLQPLAGQDRLGAFEFAGIWVAALGQERLL